MNAVSPKQLLLLPRLHADLNHLDEQKCYYSFHNTLNPMDSGVNEFEAEKYFSLHVQSAVTNTLSIKFNGNPYSQNTFVCAIKLCHSRKTFLLNISIILLAAYCLSL